MNRHMIKLKKANMLCNKCVLKVLKALTVIEELEELEVDLDKNLIKIVCSDVCITKELLTEIVNNAVEGIKPRKSIIMN